MNFSMSELWRRDAVSDSAFSKKSREQTLSDSFVMSVSFSETSFSKSEAIS